MYRSQSPPALARLQALDIEPYFVRIFLSYGHDDYVSLALAIASMNSREHSAAA